MVMYGDRIEHRYSENMPTPQEGSFSFQKRGLRISEVRGMRTNCSPPLMITFQLDSALKSNNSSASMEEDVLA